jgi:cytochrome c oxidase subunit 3/cytochrome o ubiquinol oxidase subunit 3
MADAHADLVHTEYTSTGLRSTKLAMWLFLASECLLFGGLITAYVLYRGQSTTGPYPQDVFDIGYTSVSSFVLLASSLTMVLSHNAALARDYARMRLWLLATAMLGLCFVGGQVFEFTSFFREGLTLHTNLFGSTFFVLTGFHGVHVTVGILMLLLLVAFSFRGSLSDDPAFPVEMVGLYWHFVDIVWIVIFTVVYLIPAPPPHGAV